MGTQIILGNTYHLNIRPGLEIITAAGGLHKFMNWDKPILTDSGGFQVFSLAKIRKIKAHGVEFRSHLDGSPLFSARRKPWKSSVCSVRTSPWFSTNARRTIAPAKEQRHAPWNAPSLGARMPRTTARPRARKFSASSRAASTPRCVRMRQGIVAMDFDGYAIGGVSVGEPEPEMLKAVELASLICRPHKARYAMGLGTPGANGRIRGARRGYV